MKKFAALVLFLALLPLQAALGDAENLDTGGGFGTPGAALITLSARESSTTSSDQANFYGSGLSCLFSMTTQAGDPTFNFVIEGKDATSSAYYPLLSSDSITSANGLTNLRAVVHPGIAPNPGTSTSTPVSSAITTITTGVADMVPYIWRVAALIVPNTPSSPTPSITGTIGCSLVR